MSKYIDILDSLHYAFHLPTPFASAGAFAKHAEHSLDEHGISCLRYSSLTIFCTFPDLVDLTNTLLEIFEAYGSASDRLRLVMAAISFPDTAVSRFRPDSPPYSLWYTHPDHVGAKLLWCRCKQE